MKKAFDWKTGNTKAVAILRVSSHRQAGNTSHEVQLERIKNYVQMEGLELPEDRVFKIVESAKDADDRKLYAEIIQKALKNGWRHIVYYSTDREGRNFTDIESAQKLIKGNQLVVHYALEQKKLHKHSPRSDFLMREFQAIQDKQLSATISEKVNDAMTKKAEDGHYPGNRPPLGYVQLKQKDALGRELKRGTQIAIDPDERHVKQVRREFELRAQGHSYKSIRETIIREGLIYAGEVKTYRKSTIEKRLKNPFYRGVFIWQGCEYQGNYPLLVSQEILERVDKSFGKTLFKVNQNRSHFGGGWLKCHECGCNVVYDPKKKFTAPDGTVNFKHHYYHCTNGKRKHTSMKGMSVDEKVIWKHLEKAVEQITITNELAEQIADALNATKKKMIDATERDIEAFKFAEKELQEKEDKVFDLYSSGQIEQEVYKHQRERIRRQRDENTESLKAAQIKISSAGMETAQSVLELATRAKSLWNERTSPERVELLNKLLSNPTLDGATVRFEMKKPFAVLVEMKRSEEWRPHGDVAERKCQVSLSG